MYFWSLFGMRRPTSPMPLKPRKKIQNLVERSLHGLPTYEWILKVQKAPNTFDDLTGCLVTRIEHHRSTTKEHEFVIVHYCSKLGDKRAVILERHKEGDKRRQDYITAQDCDWITMAIVPTFKWYRQFKPVQFFVPSKSINIVKCITLVVALTELARPFSITAHMSMWWASTFFHCIREMCGISCTVAPRFLFHWKHSAMIRRGKAFKRRGRFGGVMVVDDECRLNARLDEELIRSIGLSELTMKEEIGIEEFKRAMDADRARLFSIEGDVFRILGERQEELEKDLEMKMRK